jgi:hypothetical protein
MRPLYSACLALGLVLAPAPAFAFFPVLLLSALATAAVGAAGSAAMSGAGIGPAGRRAATTPAYTGSVQQRSAYANAQARKPSRKLAKHQ